MIYVAGGLSVVVFFWLLGRAFLAATPATLAAFLRWIAVLGGLVLLAVLAWRGLIIPAIGVAASVLVTLLRAQPIWDRLAGLRGPRPGQSSDVETPFLRMSLDHDTGEMSGTVRRGPFLGRRLEELSQADLLSLCRECRAEDEPSAALVESFLDRGFPGWREADGPAGRAEAPPRRGAAMTEEEAWEVLDLPPGSLADEIRAAHRRLMMKLHPDHGGTTWLAARLNEARDVLLRKTRV